VDSNSSLDTVVIVALGSNLRGRFASRRLLLEAALETLAEAGLEVVKRSGWWRSQAWPQPTQPEYLNGVALVETALTPREAVGRLLAIEARFGRRRGGANASRTLDLDLIAHGRMVIDEPGLTLPHPRASQRRFVMGPLAEIAPSWRHPTLGETAAELSTMATIGLDATAQFAPTRRSVETGQSGEA
jgi:2-amino-4-hydroxy-6-hydroxymethyldihydropteridine diphosphokinase